MAKMDDGTLKAILAAKITNSLGFFGGRVAKDRIQAMQYYHGEPFGNEMEGRSSVVSRDVAEVIDGMMPSLMKVFASGDEIVRFDPRSEEDEKLADQATDYCNWVWQKNNGFTVMHDWFKDALLQRLGTIKIWWEDKEDTTQEKYRGITDPELKILEQDDEVEIVEQEDYPVPPELAQVMQGQLHDVTVQRTTTKGKVCVASVAPDEFLTERRATSVNDMDSMTFCAHRFKTTRSDLIEMGFNADDVNSLPGDGQSEYNMERIERFRQEDELPYRTDGALDESTTEVWCTEAYIKVDYEGKGIAEWRKVTLGGETSYVILDNESISDHPFATLTPIPMPHKLFGMSVADQTIDIQLIKSTLWRNSLDNLYQSNNSRVVVIEGQVNLDDLLTVRPGGVIRAKSQGAVEALQVPDITSGAMNMIEYTDAVKEKRTGQAAVNQGVDVDVLNSTAAGISMQQEAGNQRLELIARVFSETGIKRAFQRILHLMTEFQTEPVTLRLRNQWVTMDPREWKNDYDVIINVGLGTGDKRQQQATMMGMINLDKELIQLQGGLHGPFVSPENLYNKLKKLCEVSGNKDVDSYYTDPATYQPPPPPPPQANPDLVKIQAQTQADTQKMQIQAQIDSQKDQRTAQLEQQEQQLQAAQVQRQQELEAQRGLLEAQHQAALEQMKIESDNRMAMAKMQIEQHKIEADHVIEQAKQQHEYNIAQMQLAATQGMEKWKVEQNAMLQITLAQMKGEKEPSPPKVELPTEGKPSDTPDETVTPDVTPKKKSKRVTTITAPSGNTYTAETKDVDE